MKKRIRVSALAKWLVPATFFAASGGILYEIFLGALGSYLFGDSVKIFSLTTGAYMFCMGVGAFAVRPSSEGAVRRLLVVELALMALHLAAPFGIWWLFTEGWGANLLFWLVLIVSGVLVGMEIPLVLSVVREREGSSDARVHQVLAADYFGALVASLLFGFWLLPQVGLVATAAFSTVLEGLAVVCLIGTEPKSLRKRSGRAAAGLWVLFFPAGVAVLCGATRIERWLEKRWTESCLSATYLHSEWTGFNHVALMTMPMDDGSERQNVLLLNGQIQWATGRYLHPYHETLVIPAAESFRRKSGRAPDRVLILGGGDGFIADRFRKLYGTQSITLLEIDKRIVELARSTDFWREAGGSIFAEPGMDVRIGDAYGLVRSGQVQGPFDVIVFDLPVPSTPALARFFTPGFLASVGKLLAEGGVLSIQSSSRGGSPFGREQFVCSIERSLKEARLLPETLVGVDLDFYTVASRKPMEWPEESQALPGRFVKSGAVVAALRTDPWNRFGAQCPAGPDHGLLRPVLLEF